MRNGKAIQNSLRLVNIYNDLRDMLDKQQTMKNVGREEFNELLNIRSLVHNAIMESLEDISGSENRIAILNKI
jgi:hypothetical protein